MKLHLAIRICDRGGDGFLCCRLGLGSTILEPDLYGARRHVELLADRFAYLGRRLWCFYDGAKTQPVNMMYSIAAFIRPRCSTLTGKGIFQNTELRLCRSATVLDLERIDVGQAPASSAAGVVVPVVAMEPSTV